MYRIDYVNESNDTFYGYDKCVCFAYFTCFAMSSDIKLNMAGLMCTDWW